jgi:hypothetical protein
MDTDIILTLTLPLRLIGMLFTLPLQIFFDINIDWGFGEP